MAEDLVKIWKDHVYEEPTKKLKNLEDVDIFQTTNTLREYVEFIMEVQNSVQSKSISQTKDSGKFVKIVAYLTKLTELVDETPPIQQPMRFGNKAFKDWHSKMQQETENFLKDLLGEEFKGAIVELRVYLIDSYGSNVRLDYGTGHEMAFTFFLLSLKKLGFYSKDDLEVLCRHVFYKYVNLMRKIQIDYMLEPAGSHGVWGLDDYHFLPFLYGASELIGNKIVPSPGDIHNEGVVRENEKEYMYLHCIDFIRQQKKGRFHEHSPILNDISGAANWQKVSMGMVKMYKVEVLSKFPVIKHIFFGSILPFK